jgi:RNA polymerase sigma-70 factor (ECF subfamily)
MDRTFDKLVQEYQHRIFTYSSYHLGNQDEAQDVTQEVLLRLWKHWEELEPEIVWPWLVRVTRNASIDAIRKRNVQRRRIESDPEGERVTRVPSSEPLPDALVETNDFSERLQQALQDLAEPYRSIVILREIQQLKYEEISAALELPLNTIKVYLHRGRRKLRTALQEYRYDEPL